MKLDDFFKFLYKLPVDDYYHNQGLCNLTRLYRCFTDLCVHDEDIM